MSYTTFAGEVVPDMGYASDGTYYRIGHFPRTDKATGHAHRAPKVELRWGPICEGCGTQRSTANRCMCNS